MRYGIFSDVHGNVEALEAVLEFYEKENIDQYICLGDTIGYGANPNEAIRLVKKIANFVVLGNHDDAVRRRFDTFEFNLAAQQSIEWTKKVIEKELLEWLEGLGYTILLYPFIFSHGSLFNPQDFNYIFFAENALQHISVMPKEYPISFLGHSHIPALFIYKPEEKPPVLIRDYPYEVKIEEKAKYIFNVGSVGQPRDGDNRASCAIFDTDENIFRLYRIKYDYLKSRQKIIDAGLPSELGNRLIYGY
ncbi:MAG: metallophosphoesterase [Deltaproteobacteria bacterium]|nr:metallophosphoesterase family protein [Deltaproteobacteria bacterium]RLA90941.1 MAG: metallophosphoesterase [Deltaproteobacteria bacterium]